MPLRISEFFGFLLGYPAGLFLAAGSILRNARIFHPRGLLFCGEVETLPDSPITLSSHALIRFSGGWWKYKEWPDALGIAVRVSEQKINSVHPGKTDRDILFASFRHPWELFISSLFTDHHDYLANSYYAISPFLLDDGRKIDFMIDPVRGLRSVGTREEKLMGEVIGGKVVLRVMVKETSNKAWRMAARIRVKEESGLDQESLRFHPFQCGPDMRPYGFIHHLRVGAYKMSQWVRPGKEFAPGELTID